MAIARPAHSMSRRTSPNSPMRFAADDCARPWRRARARFSGGIHRQYPNIPGAAAFRGTTILRPRKICRRLEKASGNVSLADKSPSQSHFSLQRVRMGQPRAGPETRILTPLAFLPVFRILASEFHFGDQWPSFLLGGSRLTQIIAIAAPSKAPNPAHTIFARMSCSVFIAAQTLLDCAYKFRYGQAKVVRRFQPERTKIGRLRRAAAGCRERGKTTL